MPKTPQENALVVFRPVRADEMPPADHLADDATYKNKFPIPGSTISKKTGKANIYIISQNKKTNIEK